MAPSEIKPAWVQRRWGRIFVVASAVVLTLAVALALATLILANTGRVEVRIGEAIFRGLDAGRTAARIASEGPLLLPDPAKGNRPIWVNHLGDDPEKGWVAFDALAPGCDRSLEWNRASARFLDPCTGRSFNSSGDGLVRHSVRVVEGKLEIRLSNPPSHRR